MKTMAISVFKARALQVLDTVSKTKESVVVTRRGRPLAEVVPFRAQKINRRRESWPRRWCSKKTIDLADRAVGLAMPVNEVCPGYARMDLVACATRETFPQKASLIANPKRYEEFLLSRNIGMGVLQYCWKRRRCGHILRSARLAFGCSWRCPKLPLGSAFLRQIAYIAPPRFPQPFSSDPADQIIAATAREENADNPNQGRIDSDGILTCGRCGKNW